MNKIRYSDSEAGRDPKLLARRARGLLFSAAHVVPLLASWQTSRPFPSAIGRPARRRVLQQNGMRCRHALRARQAGLKKSVGILTAGWRDKSEKVMQRRTATVITVMLKEQSWPEGANQWYRSPAMVMLPLKHSTAKAKQKKSSG